LKNDPSLRRRLAPYPFTPKAGANGALAAAPSKPGFGLLEGKAAERAKKFLCRTYGALILSNLPSPAGLGYQYSALPR
jgi:hypothetical protein